MKRPRRHTPSNRVSDEELTRQALRLLWKDGFIRPARNGRWQLTDKGKQAAGKQPINRRGVH